MEPRTIFYPEYKTVIDLGCWQGETTEAYAEAWPNAKIIGVELMADNYIVASDRLAKYGNRIHLINAGVWSHDGYVDCSVWASETSHIAATREAVQGTPAVMPCLTLDSITKHLSHIDYIKFDIEASEHEVLRHGGDWVEKTNYIFVEIHDVSNDRVKELCSDLGFKIVREEFEKVWATSG